MGDFLSGIADRLFELFDPVTLGTAAADLLANLIIGVATFFAYYLLWRIADRIARLLTRRMSVDATTRDFTLTMLKFVVLTLGLVNALSSVGVNTASLLTSLGIAGLTVGFAARDALSNLISGLLIYWDRPFVIGDLVDIGPEYGRVERITLRSTRVVTPDGRMLAVPNTQIINTTIASYTNFPHLRIDVRVTVGVGEDLERARSIMLGVATEEAGFMPSPAPKVVVSRLNDYNVELELRVWLDDERRHIERRAALREAVFEALRAEGVEMPFETLQLRPLEVVGAGAA